MTKNIKRNKHVDEIKNENKGILKKETVNEITKVKTKHNIKEEEEKDNIDRIAIRKTRNAKMQETVDKITKGKVLFSLKTFPPKKLCSSTKI